MSRVLETACKAVQMVSQDARITKVKLWCSPCGSFLQWWMRIEGYHLRYKGSYGYLTLLAERSASGQWMYYDGHSYGVPM